MARMARRRATTCGAAPAGAGTWTAVTGVTSPYTLTGLSGATAIDVEVQGTNAAEPRSMVGDRDGVDVGRDSGAGQLGRGDDADPQHARRSERWRAVDRDGGSDSGDRGLLRLVRQQHGDTDLRPDRRGCRRPDRRLGPMVQRAGHRRDILPVDVGAGRGRTLSAPWSPRPSPCRNRRNGKHSARRRAGHRRWHGAPADDPVERRATQHDDRGPQEHSAHADVAADETSARAVRSPARRIARMCCSPGSCRVAPEGRCAGWSPRSRGSKPASDMPIRKRRPINCHRSVTKACGTSSTPQHGQAPDDQVPRPDPVGQPPQPGAASTLPTADAAITRPEVNTTCARPAPVAPT